MTWGVFRRILASVMDAFAKVLQAERLSLKLYNRGQRWHAVLKPYPSSGQDEMHGKGVTWQDAIENVFQGFAVSTRGGEGSRKGRYDPSLRTDKAWPGWGRQHVGYAVGKAKSAKPVEGAEADIDLDIREVQNASIRRAVRPSKGTEVPEYRDWHREGLLRSMRPQPSMKSGARIQKAMDEAVAAEQARAEAAEQARAEAEPSAAESKEAIKAARAARRAAKGQKAPGRKPSAEKLATEERAAFDKAVAAAERQEAQEAVREEAPPPAPAPRRSTERTATGERVSLPDAPRPGTKLPF